MDAVDTVDTLDAVAATGGRREVISFTRHARRRSARRNVAPDAVEYVLAYGRMAQRTGVMFFFLGRRDIPACDRCASWATRLEGTVVLVAPDGAVITVYRDRHGFRPITRKTKYRLFERKPCARDDSCATDTGDAGVNADPGEARPLMAARATA